MRFATFNIMNGRSLSDGLVDPGRVREAVASLDADVVGLQEVDRGQTRSHNADLAMIAADALDAPYMSFVPAVVGTPGVGFRVATDADHTITEPLYGIALISRWKVVDWQITRLPPAPVRSPLLVPGPRRPRLRFFADEPRVMIAAVVDSPIGRMTVATTHLSFVPGWNYRQLRMAVRALRRLPGPRVLLADLNIPGKLAGPLSGWRRLGAIPTYPSPAPRVQFDHILLDRLDGGSMPAVISVTTPRVAISDHRPLVVELSAGL